VGGGRATRTPVGGGPRPEAAPGAAAMPPGPAADPGARSPTVKPIHGLGAGVRRIEERLRAGGRRWGRWAAGGIVALVVLIEGVPWVVSAFTTVSTDDAFVSGHVTFVAPRVAGQVARVLVDDNNRVHKGDVLVELAREPYQVELKIAEAAVNASEADLGAVRAEVRGVAGRARGQRFALGHASEDLHKQVAELRARVAALQSSKA